MIHVVFSPWHENDKHTQLVEPEDGSKWALKGLFSVVVDWDTGKPRKLMFPCCAWKHDMFLSCTSQEFASKQVPRMRHVLKLSPFGQMLGCWSGFKLALCFYHHHHHHHYHHHHHHHPHHHYLFLFELRPWWKEKTCFQKHLQRTRVSKWCFLVLLSFCHVAETAFLKKFSPCGKTGKHFRNMCPLQIFFAKASSFSQRLTSRKKNVIVVSRLVSRIVHA